MTVFLVRHAHALSRAQWNGSDLKRPLSPRGRRQAAGLCTSLRPESIGRVLSSPATRCLETVAPLAEDIGLKVKHRDQLLESTSPAELFELLLDAARRARPTLACTHGDLVPEVLRWLSGMGIPLDGGQRWEKGSTWVLEWGGDRFVAARYMPPVEA